MADEKLTKLASPASALASYLDELLHTATDKALREATSVEAPVPEVTVQPTVQTAVITTKPKTVEKPSPAPVSVIPPSPVPQHPAIEQAALPSTRPEWSEAPFECLIFTVAGLQLAVPLIHLGAIHRIEEDIRPIPGSPRWYMGIRAGQQKNLRIVDTAEWIMAGRVPDNARDNYRLVIRLDSSDWGLACDDVAQSFTLDPDEVRWRTERSKRPWLAGTVISHMCALLDVRTMADLLARAEREQHLDLS
jgi:purine-binding chemotaxis protein CheW